jgi:hypothetical protein
MDDTLEFLDEELTHSSNWSSVSKRRKSNAITS